MTTPNSNDFFSEMGAGSPAPGRPKTTLARPPPKVGTTGGVTTLKKAPSAGAAGGVRPITARPATAAGRTTSAGRTTAGRTSAGRVAAGRTTSAGRTAAGRTTSAGRTAPGRTTSAGRTTAGRGRTASGRTAGRVTGRTSAGRRPTTARGTRPDTATSPAAAPVGGTGFYNPSASTHLSNGSTPTASTNPYAAGATPTSTSAAATPSSDAWFSATPEAQQTSTAMNPYATAPAPANNNAFGAGATVNQWQQSQQQGAGANVNQWQQSQQQQQQQQPNVNQWAQPQQSQQAQQLQALASMGGSFLMNSMMNSGGAAPAAQPTAPAGQQKSYNDDIENEPPLLEELGINLEHIKAKCLAVILPFKKVSGHVIHMDPSVIVEDADLAGPLIFALLLGGELLMTGKMHFGYIYGFGLFGCLALTLILNLMTPKDAISVWTVASVLGYALLPVNILAAVKIIVVNIIRLETFGRILALLAVLWSTVASTRLLEVGCGLRHQRYLIGYPIALLYSAFVLLTMF